MRVCSILLLLFSVVNSQCVSSTRPTCSDGAKNNGETGIDCGGPCEPCSLTVFGGNVPIFTGASCILEATETDPDVTGQFTFSTTQKDTQYDPLEPPPQLMTISYTTNGMTQGDHKFHVHNLGNIWSPDGYTVEAHFVGTVQSGSRPSLEAQEVGLLNYDTPIQVIESGQAAGTFTDTQARLNEKNSIVGRSVIVHSPGENSLTRDAQCVIGITGISSGAEIPDTPIVTRAVCILKPTSVTTRPIRGFVDLKLNEKNKIEVRIYVAGLDASTSYKIFVNQFGDLSDTTGAKTGSVFTGSKFTPDPVLGRYRVGEIGNFNFWLNSSATGVAKAWLVDNLLALNGVNSILGRAITIQTAENAPVLADCVVGLDEGYGTEGKYWVPTVINDTYPVVMGAVANLQATAGNSANIQGYIYFSALPFNHPVTPGGAIRIRGWVTGLLPSTTYPIWVSNRGDLGDNPSSLGEGTLGGQFTSNHPAGTPVSLGTITTDANGYARFLISSLDIMLANYNSIVGRAILIGSPAVALGLVGIEREDFASNAYGPPTVNKASCLLQPTAKGVANFTTGYVTFTTTPTGVLVDWNITAAGTAYTWHVHRNGDIYDASSGLAVGPHFQGAITQRTTGGWCEAGMLNNDGVIPSSPPFTDNYISLNGKNSIVGRAVIVHNSDGTRAAQCVIGVVEYDSGYTVQAAQIPPSPDDNTADCLVVDCSGHGACLNGTCKCDKGWSGAICNVQEPGNSAARAFALSPLLSLFVGLFVARQM